MSSSRMGPGARGFGEEFWRTNYGKPEAMDGIVNAEAHARYLRASFDVVMQEVSSIADFGLGLGHLFAAVLHAFRPYKALGLEPSGYALEQAKTRPLAPDGTRLRLEQVDLYTWCQRPDRAKDRFDLGVCTSVLQYLDDDELELVIPTLARRVKYLYLTVPSATELDHQEQVEQFYDRWAIRRSRQVWRDWIGPHFVVVGARLLESRYNVETSRSPFTDHLFRHGW